MATSNLTEVLQQTESANPRYLEMIEYYRISNGWTQLQFIEALADLAQQTVYMKYEEYEAEIQENEKVPEMQEPRHPCADPRYAANGHKTRPL